MKLTLLIVAFVIGFLPIDSFSKVWIVNNNLGGAGDFAEAQAAHDAAVAGDTLYLVGSATSYSLTIAKNMTVMGEGYFLTENNIYNIPKSNSLLRLGTIAGDVTELNIKNVELDGEFSITASLKLFLEKCKINSRINFYPSGIEIVVNKCFIVGPFVSFQGGRAKASITNTIVGNSLSLGSGSFLSHVSLHPTSGLLEVSNSHIENSIIRGSMTNNLSNTAINNLVYESPSEASTIPGNVYGADPLYVSNQQSLDSHYQLQDTSPGKGAGTGGVDIGAFGGSSPYEISGVPDRPIFEVFTTPTTGSKASGLPVIIRVRAN